MEKQLSDQVTVTLGGHSFIIDYPNAGQTIDIEKGKIRHSEGLYGQMIRTGTVSANESLDIIDSVSFFEACVPGLKERQRVEGLMDLKIREMNEVIKQYKEVVAPWLEAWKTELTALDEKPTKEGE